MSNSVGVQPTPDIQALIEHLSEMAKAEFAYGSTANWRMLEAAVAALSALSGETETEWEYGFQDSADPGRTYWSTFGGLVGFTSADSARGTASKSVFGQAVIVRRRPAGPVEVV